MAFKIIVIFCAALLLAVSAAPAEQLDLSAPEKEDLQTAASHWGGYGGHYGGHYGGWGWGGYYPHYGGYWSLPLYGHGYYGYGWPYGYNGHHGYWLK